jgi:uncharacterized membrane protein
MPAAGGDAGQQSSRSSLSAYLAGKAFELTLIGIWFCFVLSAGRERSEVSYLVAWDAVAGVYLCLGLLVVRRGRAIRPVGGTQVAGWLRPFFGPRFEFACVLGASFAGLTSVYAVLTGRENAMKVAGALAIVFAWTLLHAGYARLYASLCQLSRAAPPPLVFPAGGVPTLTDFFYFSFTLGTSSAVSDVAVTTTDMRWHVMVHGVLSFFYNAVVLAVAIGILTNR